MRIILGDICYPKSEALIIPANTKGVMSRGVPAKISKDGLGSITKEVKQIITNSYIEVGDCFSTGPGRLKRRGLKRIYHTVIKRFQNDFSSTFIINKALNNVLQEVVGDGYPSVAICGLGIEPGDLDPKSVAKITAKVCNKYNDSIKINIIDDNEEFIKEFSSFIKEFINVYIE